MQVRYSGITGMGLAKIALVCIIGLSCLYSQEIPARIEIRVPIHLEVDDEQSGTIAFLDLLGNTVHLKHAVHIKLRTVTVHAPVFAVFQVCRSILLDKSRRIV
jgi:hypothetical protein